MYRLFSKVDHLFEVVDLFWTVRSLSLCKSCCNNKLQVDRFFEVVDRFEQGVSLKRESFLVVDRKFSGSLD